MNDEVCRTGAKVPRRTCTRRPSGARLARWHLDVPGQHEQAQQEIRQVDLPPVALITGATRLGMVIVVPALAAREDCYKPVVAAVIASVVILIAEHMRQR